MCLCKNSFTDSQIQILKIEKPFAAPFNTRLVHVCLCMLFSVSVGVRCCVVGWPLFLCSCPSWATVTPLSLNDSSCPSRLPLLENTKTCSRVCSQTPASSTVNTTQSEAQTKRPRSDDIRCDFLYWIYLSDSYCSNVSCMNLLPLWTHPLSLSGVFHQMAHFCDSIDQGQGLTFEW